jgi:mono/diheme cytochrome c family protein
MNMNLKTGFGIACGTAAALVIAGATSLVVSLPAAATAQFAKDTGRSCGDCHMSAQGGGPLTTLGEQFKSNGNKMPK